MAFQCNADVSGLTNNYGAVGCPVQLSVTAMKLTDAFKASVTEGA